MSERLRFTYKGEVKYLTDICEDTGVNYNSAVGKLLRNNIENGSDITELIDSLISPRYRDKYVYRGELLTKTDIWRESGLSIPTLRKIISENNLSPGDDVTGYVHTRVYLWYIYKGKRYTIQSLAVHFDVSATQVRKMILRENLEVGADLTEYTYLLTPRKWKKFKYNDRLVSCKDIAEIAELPYRVVYNRIRLLGLKSGDDITNNRMLFRKR